MATGTLLYKRNKILKSRKNLFYLLLSKKVLFSIINFDKKNSITTKFSDSKILYNVLLVDIVYMDVPKTHDRLLTPECVRIGLGKLRPEILFSLSRIYSQTRIFSRPCKLRLKMLTLQLP